LIAKLRQDHPHLKVIVTEDSLSSNAPHIEVLQDHHLHYILGSFQISVDSFSESPGSKPGHDFLSAGGEVRLPGFQRILRRFEIIIWLKNKGF
jgi:hypothetical protein